MKNVLGMSLDEKDLNASLQRIKNDAKKFRDYNITNTKKLVRESINDDNLLMQTVGLLEDLEKVTNTMSKRVREWYSLYFPEAAENIRDNEAFLRVILEKSKDELKRELKVKDSMGKDFSKKDLDEILDLAKKAKNLYDERKLKEKYLEVLMKRHAPNVTELAGVMVGSKLLSLAGGLHHLSAMPAGTIQLLGAETALFRHLKSGAKPPKHGFIINHPIVARNRNKGRVSRVLADKISIAAKVDYFKGEPIGQKLRLELEAKY